MTTSRIINAFWTMTLDAIHMPENVLQMWLDRPSTFLLLEVKQDPSFNEDGRTGQDPEELSCVSHHLIHCSCMVDL